MLVAMPTHLPVFCCSCAYRCVCACVRARVQPIVVLAAPPPPSNATAGGLFAAPPSFTVFDPNKITVGALDPALSSAQGGTSVTIAGANFITPITANKRVVVKWSILGSALSLTSYGTVRSATEISAVTPTLPAAYVKAKGYLTVYVTLSFNGIAFTDVSYSSYLTYYIQVCVAARAGLLRPPSRGSLASPRLASQRKAHLCPPPSACRCACSRGRFSLWLRRRLRACRLCGGARSRDWRRSSC
jgi:hypothetical protein